LLAVSLITLNVSANPPTKLKEFKAVVKVTPGIEGLVHEKSSQSSIFFSTNPDKTLIMNGSSVGLSVYDLISSDSGAKEFRKSMEQKQISSTDKFDFKGFLVRPDPKDKKKIEVFDFNEPSEGLKKFKCNVVGKGYINGSASRATIKISTTVGVLQDLLPYETTKYIQMPNSGIALGDFSDKSQIVDLAQFEIAGI
jgi:hypothetical protein